MFRVAGLHIAGYHRLLSFFAIALLLWLMTMRDRQMVRGLSAFVAERAGFHPGEEIESFVGACQFDRSCLSDWAAREKGMTS